MIPVRMRLDDRIEENQFAEKQNQLQERMEEIEEKLKIHAQQESLESMEDVSGTIAWGNTLISHRQTIQAKTDLLTMMKDKGLSKQVKCIVTDNMKADGVHPLYLGLRHSKDVWRLQPYPLETVLKELENTEKKASGKSSTKASDENKEAASAANSEGDSAESKEMVPAENGEKVSAENGKKKKEVKRNVPPDKK